MDLDDALVEWDEADDANGNTIHIAEHDLTLEEIVPEPRS